MEIITLTKENLDREHICCAISNNQDCQVASKKAWLRERLDDGLMFKKCDVRGKCFIEYIPAERAWAPVYAPGYMYINCLWVSGQFKGQGYSNLLLEACIQDSREKGKKGLVSLSAVKKQSFLSDPQFLTYKGFLQADTAAPFYVLYYLPFDKAAEKPHFYPQAATPRIAEQGFVLYYSPQCPYTAKYVPLVEAIAKERNAPFQAVRFESAQQAQNAPAPFTAYSLFYNGELLTHEIQSDRKFDKLLTEKGY
ncbi:MAG: N-acetyltransferase [Eubacteriales bacterium]|nr:N-acetyltransferase [Eubacteriales bacterium]